MAQVVWALLFAAAALGAFSAFNPFMDWLQAILRRDMGVKR